MIRFEKPTFTNVALADVTRIVADFKSRGYGFVQLCASTLEDSCDLLYAFTDPEAAEPGMIGVVANVPDGVHVPSITEWYPAAFVFENETHDLFGIDFDGINIDFGGNFYTLSMDYPMNPRAAMQKEAQHEEKEAQDE